MTDEGKPKKPRKRKTPVAGTDVTEPARDSDPSLTRDSDPSLQGDAADNDAMLASDTKPRPSDGTKPDASTDVTADDGQLDNKPGVTKPPLDNPDDTPGASKPDDDKPGASNEATSPMPDDAKPATSAMPDDAKPATSPKPDDENRDDAKRDDEKPATSVKPDDAKSATSPKPDDEKPATSVKPDDATSPKPDDATSATPDDAKPATSVKPDDAKPVSGVPLTSRTPESLAATKTAPMAGVPGESRPPAEEFKLVDPTPTPGVSASTPGEPRSSTAPEHVEVAKTAPMAAVPMSVSDAKADAIVVPVEVAATQAVQTAPSTKPISAASEAGGSRDSSSASDASSDAVAGSRDSSSNAGSEASSDAVAGVTSGAFIAEASDKPVTPVDLDEPRVEYDGESPEFMLASEGFLPPPPAPQILPSPQEAALEAARIVSQMVDIDSESGAVIAAAAAAGAAIEAAHAAQKAAAIAELDPRSSSPSLRLGDLHSAHSTHDPVTTVRLSRDRILQALANEEDGTAPAARDSASRLPRLTEPGRVRARTEPGIPDDEAYEEFDPVAIAAAAISRLRQRARTDLAELRVHYHRHDVLVLLAALVIIVVAGRVHERLVTPPNELFKERGLIFQHSTTWLRPEPLPVIAPRIVRDQAGGTPTKDENLYHVELTAVGSTAKLEVLIDKKPTWSNIVTGLELDRRTRWGELYTLDNSSVRSIAGHDWLRTGYRYAHVPEKNDEPRIDHAIEYATIDREQIYVVTLFGTPGELGQTEEVVAPSLRVQSQTGLPLVPQTSRLSQRKYPGPVGLAFESTVMVVVADLVDGRLRARGGGSGVIVGAEGSILTNYHVLHDKNGRLHDTFVIGRFSALDRAPQLQCAGRPSRSKLLRELDLALIKCDMDLDGRTWSPSSSAGVWATLLESRVADIKMGQRLWVLGYPDVGGGGLTLSVGEVEGWTGEDGTQGKDFIKTDASITHGNSGGPVIDDQGKLVGIAAAFRTRVSAAGGVIETAQVGLVRPLHIASNLLAYAAAGWTPREGYNDVELAPSAVEAAAEGVRIYTNVIDDANEAPVRDATVMILKAGINTTTIDMNRLDDQAIAWGKTNAQGEVRLKQLVPVPGRYTVMVIAPGYEPLISDSQTELVLDERTPPSFDPWGKIGLRSR